MCLLVFAFAFIYRRTHSASLLAWTEVQQLLDAVLRSSDERDELLQRLSRQCCHRDIMRIFIHQTNMVDNSKQKQLQHRQKLSIMSTGVIIITSSSTQ